MATRNSIHFPIPCVDRYGSMTKCRPIGYKRKFWVCKFQEVSLIRVGSVSSLFPSCWVELVVITGALAALDHEATLGMEVTVS